MKKLTIELIPKSSAYKNVRSEVTKETWDKIRRFVYKRANYKCEICGGKGETHPVECHEKWKYYYTDIYGGKQILLGFEALCPDCHEVKHIGLAHYRGRSKRALKHLAQINHWTTDAAEKYLKERIHEWSIRTNDLWDVDISYLDKFNYEI